MANQGFGYGPFGQERFGYWKWARQVLFDFLPVDYRNLDKLNNDYHDKFSKAQSPLFENFRDKIRTFSDLRDPDIVRSQYSEVALLRLGRVFPIIGEVTQRGLDGEILFGGDFTSESARFSAEDLDRDLIIYDSSVASNNKTVKISSILSTTSVRTTPLLSVDAGPIFWQVRSISDQTFVRVEVQSGDVSFVNPSWTIFDGHTNLKVQARRQFQTTDRESRLLTEREGLDGSINSSGYFVSTSANFSQRDTGKQLSISGSSDDDNNLRFEIRKVESSTVALTSFEVIRGEDSNGGVTYSALGADLGGEIPRVTHIKAGLLTPLSLSVDGGDITVNLATNLLEDVISTAQDVADLINADSTASLIVRAGTTGTGLGTASPSPFIDIPGFLLFEDAGPLTWAILPRPELDIEGLTIPKGVVEQEGNDLSIISAGASSRIRSTSAKFMAGDLGKKLTIRGSPTGNDGTYDVISVVSEIELDIDVQLTTLESDLFWELREETSVGDSVQVRASAQALLPFLAQDYGIEVDTQESEEKQRRYVKSITKWINKKGHQEAYKIIGLLTGFDVTLTQLFRISQDLTQTTTSEYEVGSEDPTKFGFEGSLTAGTMGRTRFSAVDSLANFEISDVGSSIAVTGAATGGNNKTYEIEVFIDSKTVEFRFEDQAVTLPDANNGDLSWTITKFYTDLSSELPVYDEINADAMEEYVTAVNTADPTPPKVFGIDRFCWEEDFYTTIQTNITAVTSETSTSHTVTVALTGLVGPIPIGNIREIIMSLGVWQLVDSNNLPSFLETLPEDAAPGFAQFKVSTTVAPIVGPATITYICPFTDLGCGYCPASVALARIEYEDLTETESIDGLGRVLSRLEQVTPIHVRLITHIVR